MIPLRPGEVYDSLPSVRTEKRWSIVKDCREIKGTGCTTVIEMREYAKSIGGVLRIVDVTEKDRLVGYVKAHLSY